MPTPPDHEPALLALVQAQIDRMRERTRGRLPPEEQQELAVLLEDLLRSHPVLGRWARSLLPRAMAKTSEVLQAVETVGRPESGHEGRLPGQVGLVEPSAHLDAGRVARVARAGARTPPKKPKKAGGTR